METQNTVNNCTLQEGGADNLTKYDYDKLDHETLVNYCVAKDRRIRRLKRVRDAIKVKVDTYKEELQLMQAKNQRRRTDADLKQQTLTLYKKILEKLVQ